ncbi:HNH endonuclease [Arthrobacter sp. zg-Y40]|uniref:HNH endonuclease n=1 Tax=Arthrobacter sp. zg-Y40 TaxID=2886939 RepID=UPI001D140F0A|nr:HNH endonuclease signature motif containing protein [Arthrobacter sp. zg-Y40]MCC3280583.1 HNH endonuclease [Arthrobacter sp. zg-Y40]
MFESIGTHGSAGPYLRLADAGPHAAFEMRPQAASAAAVAALTLDLSSPDTLAGIAADSDVELVDRLRALEELKAAACAAQARVAAAFDVSVRAAHARAGLPAEKQGVGVGAQVALARRESPARGGRILGFAKALTQEMPCTLQALSEGRISEWRATLLVRETACLSVADRRLVDREIAGNPAGLDGLGDQRLIARIRKITYRIDQAALVRRAAKAEADRFVSCRPAPDTMTYLTGLLPVAQGVAVYAALCRAADSLRARGDARGRGQIMADTMVERITGQATAVQVPVEVQLVMTDRTLLAGDKEPAHLTGYGIVPAPWARDLVGKGARRRAQKTGEPGESSPGFWLRRLYTAPSSGELLAMDSKARFVPVSLARLITVRDQTCRTPWCDAPIRHQDHIRPHRDDGPTQAANIQGLCEACNQAKEAPGWKATVIGAPGTTYQLSPRVRKATAAPTSPKAPTTRRHTVEISTPTGHRYRSTAPPLPGA